MEINQNPETTENITSTAVATAAPLEAIESETIPYNQTEAYQDQLREAFRKRAQKDMLFGALWCVGGTVLTLAHIGFIFWGAIVFGGIQFFRGLSNYNKV